MRYCFYYIVLVNVLAFLAYAIDKFQARRDKHRISENWLHLLALAGGSPGALAGQNVFRHKTAKKSFLFVYWLIVIFQILIVGYILIYKNS